MKKSIVAGILGLATVPLASSGAGYIYIGNAAAANLNYNPVIWQAPISQEVRSTQGVQLTLWYGEGILTENQLGNTMALPWDTDAESGGFPGFYGPTLVNLPNWDLGDIYTFQVRAFGNSIYGSVDTLLSRSVLWQESNHITPSSPVPASPPGTSQNSIGLTVYIPEPSTLAVGSLGLGGFLIFRRRNQA